MKLILLRHGETHYNKKELIQGQKNVRLTPFGVNQSKKAVKYISRQKIDVIFSSDLYRCKHTTKDIGKLMKTVPVHYTKELREKGFGKFEGMTRKKFQEHLESTGIPRHIYRPDGGENWIDVQKRAIKFISKIKSKYKNKTVLIVTHGGVIKSILFFIMKKSLEKWDEHKVHNASISIIEFKSGKPKIKFINYTRHLK